MVFNQFFLAHDCRYWRCPSAGHRTGVCVQWTPAESVLGLRCQGTQGQGVTTAPLCFFLRIQYRPLIIHSNWRKSEPTRKQTIAHSAALILHSLLNCVNCLYHPIRLTFARIHLKNKCYHKRDKYPLLRNDDLLYFPSQAIFIRSIDLTRGYWQIQMDDDRKQKNPPWLPSGAFYFNAMPFGITDAPATPQRWMRGSY